MCGIVAAWSRRDIISFLLTGLSRLEYRGYDSAGVAVVQDGALRSARTLERVSKLVEATKQAGLASTCGIAHTRWATHGAPAERNAHPQICGQVAIVHNGIIENYEELKDELLAAGVSFCSDTDTEVAGHLIDRYLQQGLRLPDAMQKVAAQLVGTYAIAVLSASGKEVALLRQGAPLVMGINDDGGYAASDSSALVGVCSHMQVLEDGDCAWMDKDGLHVLDRHGQSVVRAQLPVMMVDEAMELGPYRHHMQKEIHFQPQALATTLEVVGSSRQVPLEIFGTQAVKLLPQVQQVLLLACGTSYHAALVARQWIEELAGIPCTVEIASEYRYRISVPNPQALVVAISQSGETADTLGALRHAVNLGQPMTLAICNVASSSLIRETSMKFITRAGVEVGVASTKAFTTQLASLYLLALALARAKGRLDSEAERQHLHDLRHLPATVHQALSLETQIQQWAEQISQRQHALFLGRGLHYPVAMEGALKLKEISYIHSEAYPAGELKHGPLALVDHQMPVLAVAAEDSLLGKVKSNLQEVRARGGRLYVLTDSKAMQAPQSEGDQIQVLRMENQSRLLSPVVSVVPMQLLAYQVACIRGTDVDKPRNLAKSVTVE